MSNIKLVAMDLDGTLFNNESLITPECLSCIRRITDGGVTAVISTGRPFSGIPLDTVKASGVRYAITANGAGIYETDRGSCLRETSMPPELFLPILEFLLQKDIHMDAFIEGKGFSPVKCRETGMKLPVPDALKKYIVETRTRVDDLYKYIESNRLNVQKMTLNFFLDESGAFVDREEVREYLEANPKITCVCGGYHNLEFTRSDASKGDGLRWLANHLGIDIENTMAIGDTENDISILKTAGIGVAMANATPAVRELADYITASNEKDGVATAIRHFLPEYF